MTTIGLQHASIWMKVVGFVLTAFVASGGAKAAAVDSMKVGNCAGRTVSYQKVSSVDTAGAAVYYPETVMQAYKGCRITAVEIGLNDKTGCDSVSFFIARSLAGEPLYEAKFTAAKSGMATFRLAEPYTLDGQAVYVGYKVVGARMLCYSNALVNDSEWVLKDTAGWKPYDGQSTGLCATLRLTVKGDSLPKGDIRLTGMVMPEYSLTNTAIPFSGSFVNLGAERVSQLTVDYIVNGQAVASETVDGLDVEPRRKGSFALSGLQLAAEGEPQVQVAVSRVNGLPDCIPADNASRTSSMVVRNSFVKRKTLLEVFSTELCPQCPAGHEEINRVLGGKSDVVEVGHHSGFFTDSLTVDASVAYEWFYGGNTYAPAVMFDRTCMADNYPSVFRNGSPVVDIADGVLGYIYNVAVNTPAVVSIGLNRTVDPSSRRVCVNVEGQRLLPVASPDSLRLFVYLTEDSVFTENQRGASGSYWHRHSLRLSLTPTWGDAVGCSETFGGSYEASIPQSWRMDKMNVVAFVANVNAADRSDCRVMNAEEVALVDGGDAGVEAVASEDSSVQDGATVFDLSGHVITRLSGRQSFQSLALKRGVYIVRFVRDGRAMASKLCVNSGAKHEGRAM